MNYEFMQDLFSVRNDIITLQLNFEQIENIPFELKILTEDMLYKINHIHSWLIRNYNKEEHYV